jgi:hypothetical protein
MVLIYLVSYVVSNRQQRADPRRALRTRYILNGSIILVQSHTNCKTCRTVMSMFSATSKSDIDDMDAFLFFFTRVRNFVQNESTECIGRCTQRAHREGHYLGQGGERGACSGESTGPIDNIPSDAPLGA